MSAEKLPRQPEVNIGTTGHVDHGKTTMVEAITGIWTSVHSEELRRGITIKVGYADAAFYKCPSCPLPDRYSASPKCKHCGQLGELLRVVSFVDCPGHESLMANTLSGAALMDGAVLVIAADASVPQPQTREHLTALQMMGMKHIIVVQNKVDLVSEEAAWASYKAIEAFLAGTVAEGAPIIPISAQRRLNIDAVIEAIEKHVPTPPRDTSAKPLMQILRSFDVNKPGTTPAHLKGGVVGGSLLQGELMVGSDIEVRPGTLDPKTNKYTPITTKISGLGTGAGFVEKVVPGGLVAVGTVLDPSLARGDGLVGSVLGLPGDLPPVLESISMETELFEKAVGAPEQVAVDKIRLNEALRLNIGTAVTLAVTNRVKDGLVEAKLRRPAVGIAGSRAAISRRIGDRWRLIGSGLIK